MGPREEGHSIKDVVIPMRDVVIPLGMPRKDMGISLGVPKKGWSFLWTSQRRMVIPLSVPNEGCGHSGEPMKDDHSSRCSKRVCGHFFRLARGLVH
jgi:hypothetical protein